MEQRISIDVILSRSRNHHISNPLYIRRVVEHFMDQPIKEMLSWEPVTKDPELKYDMMDNLTLGMHRSYEPYKIIANRLEKAIRIDADSGARTIFKPDVFFYFASIGMLFKRIPSRFNKEIGYFMRLKVDDYIEYIESLPQWKGSWYSDRLSCFAELYHDDDRNESRTIGEVLDMAFDSLNTDSDIVMANNLKLLGDLTKKADKLDPEYFLICYRATFIWLLMVTGPLAVCSNN